MIKDSSVYFASKIVIALLNLYVIYYIANHFGSETYGNFSISLLISVTISNITATWISQAYLRKFDKECIDLGVFAISIVCMLLSTAIFSSIFYCYSFDIRNSYGELFFLSVSQSVYIIGRTILQKHRLIKKFFVLDSLRMLTILLVLVLFEFKQGLSLIIYSYIIGNMFFICVVLGNINVKSFSGETFKTLSSWFKFGFPVAIWLSLASLQLLVDRELLRYFFGDTASGNYSLSYDLILKFASILIIPISNAIYPILVENERKISNYKSVSTFLSLASLGIALLSSLFVYIFWPYVVDYTMVELPTIELSILTFGVVLWQLGLIYQKPLEMQNKTLGMVINILICIVISLLLNVCFSLLNYPSGFPITVAFSSILYLCLTYYKSSKVAR
ncbi:hypothetical protein A1OS_21745 [Enterovibrio norvegicus]|nr:hypothetical protein A1OS_21745 [Enterovibrio norvegicus]